MFAFILICVLTVQLLICNNKCKYFLAPPVVLTFLWLLVHIFNLTLGWQVEKVEYLILGLPPVMFCAGYFLVINRRFHVRKCKNIQSKQSLNNDDFSIKYNALYVVLIIEILLMVWSLITAFEVISNLTNANFWLNVHESASLIEGNFILSYSVPASYIFSGFCGLLYMKRKSSKNLIIYIIAILVALIRSFMSGNRTAILMVIVVNVFSVLLCMKKDVRLNGAKAKRRMKKLIMFAVVMAAVMFFGIASQKYDEQFASLSLREFIVQNFTGYFNLSSAAFVKWYEQGFTHTNGANTFRFFYAVLSKIGIQVSVADTNAAFITVEEITTNAFTVAKIYVEDYGIMFMAFMLLCFGMLHAHFYKKAFSNDLYKRISGQLYCGVMYIGLLYQVMSDQYVSILSMMISFYIWSIVFPRILLVRKSKGSLKHEEQYSN